MYCESYKKLNISERAYETVRRLEKELKDVFANIESIECENQARVLNAFHDCRVAAHYFNPTTGYGYDDIGRDNLDRLFAEALGGEAAIVSPQIISGTHAIFTALAGLLRPGDTMLSVSGKPYDTLMDAIGIENTAPCSLKENGVEYDQVELNGDGSFKLDEIAHKAKKLQPRVAYFQRSRGYAWRESIIPQNMQPAFEIIKKNSPNTIIVVDNCYGEFTQNAEPLAYGADIIVGSLIKNIGGGLAPTGGYIAGGKAYVERIANRMTVPGIGREAGSYFGSYLPFYQGLFNAPHVVAQSLKTSALFAKVFEFLKLPTMPASDANRSDIVQALRFNTKEELIAFCRCIQSVSPVDGHVVPEPWAMPGYQNEVIMAAGTFIQGASIELTADAPICEPFTAYVQGALNYSHGRLAVMRVLTELSTDD
ncbi:MAG: methionine gamma-lyase family protein [Christensenellaceae bacterium]|nr:methionine gamma-lyase family protein [Christensenellaceae bacterium]